MGIRTTLNHLQIYVSDRGASFPFYRYLLTYLWYRVVDDDGNHLGMRNETIDIWLKETPGEHRVSGYSRRNTGVNHIAFGVCKKQDVDLFCQEFLIPRSIKSLYDSPRHFPKYTETYYAVYFEDPDGIKLEVVFL